jgi:hypothetical protein
VRSFSLLSPRQWTADAAALSSFDRVEQLHQANKSPLTASVTTTPIFNHDRGIFPTAPLCYITLPWRIGPDDEAFPFQVQAMQAESLGSFPLVHRSGNWRP